DRCCWLRKVEPLERTLKERGYKATITGRRGYRTKERADVSSIELDENGLFKINPIIGWTKERFTQEFKERDLPVHPLVAKRYLSIGCASCTRPVAEGEDPRAGRWAHTAEVPGGEQKTECGIHIQGVPDWKV